MSTAWHDEIERAYTELEQSQQAIAQVQHDMAGRTTTVRSKNRALSVVVDAQGEVVEIKFHSRGYRSMPAPELSALLVETIAEARRQAIAEVASMFSAVLPPSMPIMDMLSGTADIDEMISEAMRQIPDLPGTPGAERG
ncbi:YbaB/EbfC family nucleoid-associated protein [Micromonospora sp. NPDC018662]|uniref:YbaB/EbfC family nucleoid-associated protein n=1 Tax=Micromonospora sp. NPDC018662 TaxID=3364238 RepID=UPI00378C4B2B